MKNGHYKVTLNVDIKNCVTEDDALQAVATLLVNSMESNGPNLEVNFELVEEHEVEYHTEDVVKELEF